MEWNKGIDRVGGHFSQWGSPIMGAVEICLRDVLGEGFLEVGSTRCFDFEAFGAFISILGWLGCLPFLYASCGTKWRSKLHCWRFP